MDSDRKKKFKNLIYAPITKIMQTSSLDSRNECYYIRTEKKSKKKTKEKRTMCDLENMVRMHAINWIPVASIITDVNLCPKLTLRMIMIGLTNGCIRFFPIGYWYGLGVCMENAVNQRMKPDKRSRRESNVEAMMANERLRTDA